MTVWKRPVERLRKLFDTVDAQGNDIENVGSLRTGEASVVEPLRQLKTESNAQDYRRFKGRQFDGFDDLTNWTAITGSLSSVSSSYTGTSAARLDTDTDNIGTMSNTSYNGLNLKDKSFSILASPVGGSGNIPFSITAIDDNGDSIEYVAGRTSDELGFLRYDFGIAEDAETGNPNLGNIQEIRISVEQADRITIDDLRIHSITTQPRIVMQFDDSLESHYTEAYQYMKKYSMPGHVSTITGRIGNAGSLSLTQMNEMYPLFEFGNHTKGHTNLANDVESKEEIREEVEDAKRWLLNHGFQRGADHFVWPFSGSTFEAQDVVSDYQITAAKGQFGSINPEITSPLNLQRIDADVQDDAAALQTVKDKIDLAVKYNTTAILFFHEIADNGTFPYITVSNFREIVDYAAASDAEVVGMEDLFSRESLFDSRQSRNQSNILSSVFLEDISQTVNYTRSTVEFNGIKRNDRALYDGGGQFTAPEDGWYRITCSVRFRDHADGDFAQLQINPSGGPQISLEQNELAGGVRPEIGGSIEVELSEGQMFFIEVEVSGSGGTPRLGGAGEGDRTYCQVRYTDK